MPNPLAALGVMQGRLVKKLEGRYQAFPYGYWQDEFVLAQQGGFHSIEWIVDYFSPILENPLLSKLGREEIRKTIQKTGVQVRSICADNFMAVPFHSENQAEALEANRIWSLIEEASTELGIRFVVIPLVDQSSILNRPEARRRFVEKMKSLTRTLPSSDLTIALETDLPPDDFRSLLEEINYPQVAVNYDIGNSAALGYRWQDEFKAYFDRIVDIHIKDRQLHGGSVLLGTGHADLLPCLKYIVASGFSGPLIMQAFRDDEGKEITLQQKLWLEKNLWN